MLANCYIDLHFRSQNANPSLPDSATSRHHRERWRFDTLTATSIATFLSTVHPDKTQVDRCCEYCHPSIAIVSHPKLRVAAVVFAISETEITEDVDNFGEQSTMRSPKIESHSIEPLQVTRFFHPKILQAAKFFTQRYTKSIDGVERR